MKYNASKGEQQFTFIQTVPYNSYQSSLDFEMYVWHHMTHNVLVYCKTHQNKHFEMIEVCNIKAPSKLQNGNNFFHTVCILESQIYY